ncbi:hypothetical protein [Clostridium gasigenes]|uniref:Uncharacterized protein n=1 Tax=Clostridium gasigenes TaxID=94869 RepID=A0A7X0S9D0_9CLOT|nr:hypothetical protein [Clostridium gasigenes]MBB6713473.1 hypothetical protein [Clostridium gasigenes]MBU3107679.1 hypothetical protein [Clostridium gasigenes]
MNKKTYLPSVKTGYAPPKEALVSYAPDGSSTPLANTVTDDIVANNISNVEFDNTEDFNVDEDITVNP